MTYNQLKERVVSYKPMRGAWNKGIKDYAIMILESVTACMGNDTIKASTPKELEEVLLNGAKDWRQYSYGGSAWCYDGDIAKTLCSPSELKRTDNGNKNPNSKENWLDVQYRALFQANALVGRIWRESKG